MASLSLNRSEISADVPVITRNNHWQKKVKLSAMNIP